MENIAIIGSREIKKEIAYKIIEKYKYILFSNIGNDNYTIISGGADGVDQAAELYAIKNHIKIQIIFPDYNRYMPLRAPLVRNDEIIKISNVIFAIWDEKSRGTQYVINQGNLKNKNLLVYSTLQNKIIINNTESLI